MAVKVDFHDKEGYVFVDIIGTSNKSDLLTAFEKIFLYSSTKKTSKMLVDCRRIDSVMPMEDIATISEKFNSIQIDYEETMNNKVTFAFLINDESFDPEIIDGALDGEGKDHSYIGTVHEEAEKWLLSKKVEVI